MIAIKTIFSLLSIVVLGATQASAERPMRILLNKGGTP